MFLSTDRTLVTYLEEEELKVSQVPLRAAHGKQAGNLSVDMVWICILSAQAANLVRFLPWTPRVPEPRLYLLTEECKNKNIKM